MYSCPVRPREWLSIVSSLKRKLTDTFLITTFAAHRLVNE
jgi:hypothetical protein